MSENDLPHLSEVLKPFDVAHSQPRDSATFTTLKRRASPSFEDVADISRKRLKEAGAPEIDRTDVTDMSSFPDELAQDLQCGCCSELVYRPVLVMPCQHFFCGSCCVLWIRNGGTNCPACRGQSTIVSPFRALQTVVDTLLRLAPHKARTEREREQADELYKVGQSLRLPAPREASPEPNINQSTDFAHPCPHCLPGNPYGYRCPQPVPDPNVDAEHAWPLDDGLPPGHAHCGNCENLLAVRAPVTTRCDMCQVFFCGIGVQGRCLAAPIISQHPHGLSAVSDLIQSADVYECFDGNTVEVDIMLDYLNSQRLTPRHIYREIVTHIQSQPGGFQPLIELDLFSDIHGVAAGADAAVEGTRNRICRVCATEVLLWGLKEWWIRERQKGFLEEAVTNRKDCKDGSSCTHQRELAHAREFNHIFTYPEPEQPAPNPQAVSEPPETESNEVPASLEADTIRNNEPPPSTNHSTPDPDFATILDYHAPPPHSMDVGDVFL
ncbi:uncharacterized protein LACBIDRAFT_309007 [Laccaria bicolor S238N-H82]|uniref:Predicted protein n=1 Tax=Laccaria bicolor (strain S238N-H82 / ATCC MYA-4686) TaxID=486041 RepID=B0CVB3_LACBS|nr:uncharacterized protein LACBIDRAFT_309007 [Laccaria bicolor S238N-H82]EDR13721.1 predicted protein [Laccaria bicolor S238N-H82]|eukprot:XP_001876219.1 predicted protein [Laccaria bicolor S238N-H82]